MADWETYINSFPTAATLSSQNLSDGPHSTLHGNLGAAINAWLIDAQAAMGSYTTFARKLAAITSANVVNPTSATYGAVGDGSTDDTTAIQAGLTALALIGGGVLVLPEGQFNVTGITVPSNVFIVGAGVGATTIHCTAALGTTVNFEGTYSALSSSSHCKNAGLRGVKITGTSTGVGINLEHASSLHLTDFRVDNVAYGIRAYGAWDSIIDGDWRVQECDYGLFYASHQNDAILSGVVDTNNIRHVGGTIESCYVTDITITGKGTDGTGTGAQKPNHITFDALKVESSFVENAPRIVLESVHAVRFQTPLFAWTNYNSGFSTPVHGVSIDGDSMQVTFASPSCTNNTTNVIDAWFYLNGTDFCTITDPMFLLNAAPSTAHIEFAGTNDRVEYPLDGLKLGPTFTPANLTISGTPTSVRQTYVRSDGRVAMTAALTLSDGYAAASTNYVDNAATGLSWKTAVACATTANITLSGEQTIDGVATSASRVLVKNQSTASQNGVYVSAAGAWSRATDMDAGSEFPGAAVLVSAGTTLANTAWTCTNTVAPTVGTTAITFAQFSGGATTLAGDVTGASSSNTVTKIRGRNVHTTAPSDGDVYLWDNTNSRWAAGPTATKSTRVVYVRLASEGGDDTNDGLTPATPVATIAAAAALLPTFGTGGQASPGGTIDVGAGTFDFSATLPLYRNFEIRGRGCAGAQGSDAFDNAGTTLRRTGNVMLVNTVPDGGSFSDWAHHVLIRDLHIDGNRDAYPGMTPIFRVEKPGFGTRFENVTSKNCPGPFVHAIQPVNFHSVGLNATNSGSVRCGLSINTGTETITLAGHGLINGDVVQFVNTTSSGLSDNVWYYVVGATTDTFQVSTTKGGSAVNLTGGDPVLLRPGGMVLEFNVSGGHATVRDVQADDNVIAPFSIIASGTSRNNKVWLEGKFENKDATRLDAVSVALTTGVCTKASHNYQTGDVVTTYDHSASWSGLLVGVFYWVKRLTSSTFELYRDPALTNKVTSLAGSGTGTIDTQKGGGGVYCHRNIVDVDQSDQTNGMTIQLGLISAQLDGVLNSESLWTSYGDHAIVRLSAVTASGTAPLTAVFGVGVTGGGGTGGHYDVLVNDVDNSVTFGDPGLEASTFWYKGTASGTATPTLVEYVQGTERFICTAVPTRSSPDGSFAINRSTGKAYLRQSGAWREIAVI